MKEQDIQSLLERYRAGTASEEDKALLEVWYLYFQAEGEDEISEQDRLQSFNNVWANLSPPIKRMWPRWGAIAAGLAGLVIAVYFLKPKAAEMKVAKVATDVSPGVNRATLTLANGKKIILTMGLKGQLATQQGAVISADNKTISYKSQSLVSHVSFNTLSTAKGEQSPYPLLLADGTKVWLNAASSITFPTAFIGKQRLVKITGEVYFDVQHNVAKPFRVESQGQVIEDLGTQFNVMTYTDEPAIKTTLIEGVVAVNGKRLKPGQQSINKNGNLTIAETDVAYQMAWKDGYFRFSEATITTVMRELARWYDIEVIYKGKVTTERFNAKISRSKNISAILRILEKTNSVNFKIEGRRITVSSKS